MVDMPDFTDDPTTLRRAILDYVREDPPVGGKVELCESAPFENIYLDTWNPRSFKNGKAKPCSSYHGPRSSILKYPYLVIRRTFPGDWDGSVLDRANALNEYDSGRPDRHDDRTTAAIILHEIGHHLMAERGHHGGASAFENEVHAWTEAKRLWSSMELCRGLGPMPRDFVSDALDGYWQGLQNSA
jgi:hypothetical protein